MLAGLLVGNLTHFCWA